MLGSLTASGSWPPFSFCTFSVSSRQHFVLRVAELAEPPARRVMKLLAPTLLAASLSSAAAEVQCAARCGSEVGFTSSNGPEVAISYDGATLTVPQQCREERCGAIEAELAELRQNAAAQAAAFEKRIAELERATSPTPAPSPCVARQLMSGATAHETNGGKAGSHSYTSPNGWVVRSLSNGGVYSNGDFYWLSNLVDGSTSCDVSTCSKRDRASTEAVHNCYYLQANDGWGGDNGVSVTLPKPVFVDHLMLDTVYRADSHITDFRLSVDGKDYTPPDLAAQIKVIETSVTWPGDWSQPGANRGGGCEGNKRFIRVDIGTTISEVKIWGFSHSGGYKGFGAIEFFSNSCH
jgi:hypothetical protein